MICISFDSDHMSNLRMVEFLDAFQIEGNATFFCTQPYASLERTEHEIAPHPTLIPQTDWTAVLNKAREDFPYATGWRSHSCVFSHLIAEWLSKNAYNYVSVHDCFLQPKPVPTKHAWGVWQIPIYYMDNLDFSYHHFWKDDNHQKFNPAIIENSLSNAGVYAYDFHPIHLLLNTPSVEYYMEIRDAFLAGEKIENLRWQGYGTASFFNQLMASMKQLNLKSLSMATALKLYSATSTPRLTEVS